jgi:sulfur carrier protein
MKLTVAGNLKEVPADITVKELIALENVETPDYVTVSINDNFIMSTEHETTVLHDGDVVEFLYFMGGGC